MARRRDVFVNLVIDTTAFEAQMRKIAESFNTFAKSSAVMRLASRGFARAAMSPGDRHIDQVCREIALGVPGRDPVVRLIAASDFAAVLDRSNNA